MTIDEAMQAVGNCSNEYFQNNGFVSDKDRHEADLFIRRLVALRVLDIEKPSSAEKKATNIIGSYIGEHGSSTPHKEAENLMTRLERAGLKIVDRGPTGAAS